MTDPGSFRVLVVDDEPHARAGIRGLLEADAEIEVVGECSDGAAAVNAITNLRPDLVLLDVQMPGMDGFDVVRTIGVERMPLVVFVTAYDRYALDAFEVSAVDYVLKPFDDDRFRTAVGRAKETLRHREVGDLSRRLIGLLERQTGQEPSRTEGAPRADSGERYVTRLVVKDGGRVFFVRAGEIDWIEAADYYVKLHVRNRVHLVRQTMRSLESRLDPARFFRVHRSAIVNLDRIRELQPYVRRSYVLVLEDGTHLKLSRSRRERLEALLDQSL